MCWTIVNTLQRKLSLRTYPQNMHNLRPREIPAIQYIYAAATLWHAKTDTHLGHRAMLQASVDIHPATLAATGTAFHSGHLDSGS